MTTNSYSAYFIVKYISIGQLLCSDPYGDKPKGKDGLIGILGFLLPVLEGYNVLFICIECNTNHRCVESLNLLI
jgi:hypothetical protein